MHSHAHPFLFYSAFNAKRKQGGRWDFLIFIANCNKFVIFKAVSLLLHRMIRCEGTTNKETRISHLRLTKETENAYMFTDVPRSVRFIRTVTAT